MGRIRLVQASQPYIFLIVVLASISSCGVLESPAPCDGSVDPSLAVWLSEAASGDRICGARVQARKDSKSYDLIDRNYPDYPTDPTACRGVYLLSGGDGYFDVSVSAETYRSIALRTYVASTKCGPITRKLDLKMEKE